MFTKKAKVEKLVVLAPFEQELLDAEVAKERASKTAGKENPQSLLKTLDKSKKRG